MEHKEPSVDMYLDRCEELFRVLQDPSIASQELVLPASLEQVDQMQPLGCESVRT